MLAKRIMYTMIMVDPCARTELVVACSSTTVVLIYVCPHKLVISFGSQGLRYLPVSRNECRIQRLRDALNSAICHEMVVGQGMGSLHSTHSLAGQRKRENMRIGESAARMNESG